MNNASRRWARVLGPAVVALAIGIPVQQASASVTVPKLVTAPAISPTTTPTVGQLMSTTSGTWSGTQPITYKYQWQRCPVGGTCGNISGATTNKYTPTTTDKGKQLRSRVIADNAASGTKTAYSARTAAVVQVSKPGIVTLPKINSSPAAVAGNTLQLTQGTWSNSPTSITDSWQRCAGSTCTAVGTGASYLLSAADVGKTIKVVETAMNGAGSTPATSQSTAAVADAPAVSPGAPTITPPSPLQDGSQLTAQNAGPWGGTNVTLFYVWQTSLNGTDTWSPAQSSTSATYTTHDVTDFVRVTVVGHNSVSDVSSGPSNVVGPVQAAPLAIVSNPTISGPLQVGQTLTANPGVFSGTNPSPPSYDWWSCPPGTSALDTNLCTSVSTDSSYVLQQADQNQVFFLTDTRTNAQTPLGLTATSAATPIPAAPPQNTVTPTISSLFPLVGQTLTVTDLGTWSSAAGPLTYTYQWMSCDTTGNNCATEPAGGTASSYLVRTYDQGRTVEVSVTATDQYNQQGTSPSAITATVTRDPGNPVITVANWAMSEQSGAVMSDSSGYGNNGVLDNVALAQADHGTNIAFGFPLVAGAPSRAIVPDSASLDPDGVNTFKVSMHVKFGALPDLATVGDYDLIRKGQSTDDNDWKIEVLDTGKARCYVNDGVHTLIADVQVSNSIWGIGPGKDGSWTTILCTFTKNSASAQVIADSGAKTGVVTSKLSSGTLAPIDNTAPLSVGSKYGGGADGGDQYTGKMDQVVITSG